jgi:uncharacterized protein (TIGR02145 family)
LLLICCGVLSLACPPDDFRQHQYADIPQDVASATITITAVAPQGDWTLRVDGHGELSDELRESANDVTSSQRECVEPCLARDYVLSCPRGKCTFHIDIMGTRSGTAPLTLSAGFIINAVEEDGCGTPDPNAVPSEDVDRLFDLTFGLQDVVRTVDAGPGALDPVLPPDAGFGTPTARGTMVDPRDGQRYATVTLGSQTWLAQNLNHGEARAGGLAAAGQPQPEPDTKLCPGDDPEACAVFGGLYTWTQSLGLPAECAHDLCAAKIAAPHRGLCPEGWHIPSRREWNTLLSHVAAVDVQLGGEQQAWASAVAALKSPLHWQAGAEGTNESELGAVPAGIAVAGGEFVPPGQLVIFQSSEEYDSQTGGGPALVAQSSFWGAVAKSSAISVRCLQD